MMGYVKRSGNREASPLDEILADLDVESWLDDNSIDYKRGSNADNLNLKACPFCGDERWRVYMSRSKKRGLCFHADCSAKFNLFGFAKQFLEADNKGTIRHFEAYAVNPSPKPHQRVAVATGGDGWEMPKNVSLPTPEGDTHPYLIQRQILLSTQKAFDMRWCESGWYRWPDPADPTRMKGMNFAGRILLPITDVDGVIKTFVGRDVTGTSDRRYLFPSSLPGTGRFLYGANLCIGAAEVVMVEGPFDVHSTYQALSAHPKFRSYGVVGSFGISVGASDEKNDDQINRLIYLKRHGLKHLTIMWDGEYNAYLKALDAGMTIIKKVGLAVSLALLPQDADPGDSDARTIYEAVDRRKTLTATSYVIGRMQNPYKSPAT